MRQFFLVSVCCCSFLLLFGQQPNAYNSLLWEISGNGLTKNSYLYGTMHVSRRIAFHLTDTFFIALRNCDMVALESNPENWMDELLTNEKLWDDDGDLATNYYYEQPNNFFEQSFEFQEHDDDVLIDLLNAEPVHINSLLFRSNNPQQSDFEEDTWLDMFIFQAGKKLGKQVGGLEDFKTTVEMSKEANKLSTKEREEFYKKIQKNAYGDNRLMERLQDAYRNADLKLLDSLSKSGYSEKYHRIMINERNQIMVNTMDSLMKNKSLFAAMGAAHLPGNAGVIALLQSKGYTVRPVYPLTNKAESMKSKIEALSYPLDFQARTSPDSVFEVSIPGVIYKGKNFGFGAEYLFPDLANGAYYSIYELGIPARYNQKNRFIDKVDSLLFEHIPGKSTFKKKYLYDNKYPAIDLITVNRRGNYERYQFLELNDYLYMLKLGGTGTYAKEKKHNKFFDSFRYLRTTENNDWKNMSYPQNGYSFKMPGKPVVIDFEYQYSGKYREIKSFDNNGNQFVFLHNFFCDFDYIEEDSFELSFIANSFSKSLEYELQTGEHIILNGLPAYKCTATCTDGKLLQIMTTLKGPDYYLMAVFGKESPLPYFESLVFTKSNSSENIDYQEDTILFYTVKTILPEIKPPKENLFEEEEEDIDAEETSNPISESGIRNENSLRYFNNGHTNEIIRLNITKIPDYTSLAEIDSLWRTTQDRLNQYGNMQISHLNSQISGDFEIMEYLATDTNSTRAIRIKSINAGDRFYELSTTIDTVYQSSAWLDTFFFTFKPLKYTSPVQIISLDSLLTNIVKGDSLYRSDAYKMLRNHKFRDEEAPAFMDFILHMNTDSFSVYSRGNILSLLSDMQHPEIPAFLEKMYIRFSDTSNLQFEILELLLTKKDIASYKLFSKLLTIETPVSGDHAQVAYLFDYLYDSAALTIQILPDLLKISDYTEYKFATYYLTAWLLNQGLISESLLLPYKKTFIDATTYLYKKNMAQRFYREIDSYRTSYLTDESEYDLDYESDYVFPAKKWNDTDSVFKKSSYSALRLNTYSEDRVHCYIDLLLPFYKDPEVKSLLDKFSRLRTSEIDLLTQTALLSRNYLEKDTSFNYYIRHEESRLLTYELLTAIGRMDLFDSTYLTQEAFAKCYLSTQVYESQDSIVLYKKDSLFTNAGEIIVYFYQIYTADKKELGWVSFADQPNELILKPAQVFYDRYYGTDELDIDKKIEKVKASFLKKNRKRLNQYENDY